jgi:hypothetical protein
MVSLPTMAVRWRKLPGRVVIINVSDFDPVLYQRLDEPVPVEREPVEAEEPRPAPRSVARRR